MLYKIHGCSQTFNFVFIRITRQSYCLISDIQLSPEGIERQMKFDVRLHTIPSGYASKIPLIARWSAKNNPITEDHESPADSGRKINPFLDLRLI